MKARRTSPGLIENAISDKWIRQLAFFHLMKLRFTNSCIYNFRSRMDEISGLFGISTKTFYNHLNILRSKDLIFDHSTNLMLAKIKCRRKSLIEIDENYSLWDVTCLLYAKLIERKARQQAFKVSLRRFGRGEKLNSELCENPFHPSLSYRTIAKLLSISEYTAYKIIYNLNRLRIIDIEKPKARIISRDFTGLKYIEDLPGHRFNIGNRLYEMYGTKIIFLKYPVYLKKITLSQYLKYNKQINKDL